MYLVFLGYEMWFEMLPYWKLLPRIDYLSSAIIIEWITFRVIANKNWRK